MQKLALIAAFVASSCCIAPAGAETVEATAQPPEKAKALVLSGGTLVALSSFGKDTNDVHDAVVVMQGAEIIAAGPRDRIEIPADAEIVDVKGRFLVPGYIDGFSMINDEAQAHAQLYMGVTTIFANMGDSRRGLIGYAELGPDVIGTSIVSGTFNGDDALLPHRGLAPPAGPPRALTSPELATLIDAARLDGYGSLLLFYPMTPEPLRAAVTHARQRGLITIGELGATSYGDAARAGMHFFVHCNRYLRDIAPPELAAAVGATPFGETRERFMEFLATTDPESPRIVAYAKELAKHRVALMGTFALMAWQLPDQPSPWTSPVAPLLDPAQIMMMRERTTDPVPSLDAMSDDQRRMARQALAVLAINRTLAKHGAKFVVASGADAFEVLPGEGEHVEMRMLTRIGLSPREALAAATENYGEIVEDLPYGKIAAGKRANVLVLSADPTVDIGNAAKIERLVLRGRFVDRAGLLTPPPAAPR